jgi:hypothetical protein
MARRLDAPLTDWTADDVIALIDERIDEGQRLEYKRELVLDSKSQRREAAKDASGLANAQGGLLIYGVEEKELDDGRRLPTAPRPLTDGGLQAQLVDVLDSAISPKLNFEDPRLLETDGGYFLVLRVFQRTGVPHMVVAYNTHRHYVRVGLKTRPMEQHELEQAYRLASEPSGRAHRRFERLPLVPWLENIEVRRREERALPGPWLSVVTLPLDAPDPLLEMRSAKSDDFPDSGDHERWGSESIRRRSYKWDDLGYADEHDDVDPVARRDDPASTERMLHHRVRLYRNGVFEWGGDCADGHSVVTLWVAERVHDVLGYFATAYQEAGYYGRVRVWVALDNARDSTLLLPQNFVSFERKTLRGPRVEWRGDENVESLLHDLGRITHAAMDRLWVAYGFERCLDFDANGKFIRAA